MFGKLPTTVGKSRKMFWKLLTTIGKLPTAIATVRKNFCSNSIFPIPKSNCCTFCAVPELEPVYNPYIPLKERIELVKETYGDQKDLLLMDNNILASKRLSNIIQDIINSGFGKKDKFIQPDLLELSIEKLQNGINENAYKRKAQGLIMSFYEKLKGEESYQVY
jgi:hypothetical protein